VTRNGSCNAPANFLPTNQTQLSAGGSPELPLFAHMGGHLRDGAARWYDGAPGFSRRRAFRVVAVNLKRGLRRLGRGTRDLARATDHEHRRATPTCGRRRSGAPSTRSRRVSARPTRSGRRGNSSSRLRCFLKHLWFSAPTFNDRLPSDDPDRNLGGAFLAYNSSGTSASGRLHVCSAGA
jgi:hypothetical protein